MADLALEPDIDTRPAGPDSGLVDDGDDLGVPAVDGTCHVLPHQPLPELSTPHASAFAAVDRTNTSQQLYALLLNPHLPFRLSNIANARDLGDVPVIKPVKWVAIDWPQTNRRETMLVLQRPSGGPLMSSADDVIPAMKSQELTRQLMRPMAVLLAALADRRMAHRNLRPSNLFRAGKDGPVVAGEFYSTPPAFDQPSVFEPIERAMCAPAGRGAGDIADDLFALGVIALFMSLGRNPVAHVDDKTLLARRARMGSYAAMTTEQKPPGDLAPVIRSLMHDNPRDRWTIDDLTRWTDGGVAVQAKPMSNTRSDRGFEFAGQNFHTRRELALAFGQNWAAAREVALTDAVERWAERSLEDRELAQQITDCRLSGGRGPRMVSDDLLLARTIITLDPAGPMHFRGLTVMPDGLGPMAALSITDTDLAANFTEMISLQLADFWLDRQPQLSQWAMAAKADADKMLGYLDKAGPGFALERCAYSLNKGLACQSPRLSAVNAVQIRDLMQALDAGMKKGEQQLDRHVAAFLAARYSGSIDKEMLDFGNARDGEEALVAQLRIFAAVQFKHGPPQLPNLASMFFDHIDVLLSPYQNVALRERLRRAAEQIAGTGKLPELLGVVRNRNYLRLDKRGFDRAKRTYAALERQVQALVDSRERIPRRAQIVGRKTATYVATCVSATVVVMVVLGGLG